MSVFQKKIKHNTIDEIISEERGYFLCGRVFGSKGSKDIETCCTGKELKKFLPSVAKAVGVAPLEVLRQLSVEEAIKINGLVREIK